MCSYAYKNSCWVAESLNWCVWLFCYLHTHTKKKISRSLLLAAELLGCCIETCPAVPLSCETGPTYRVLYQSRIRSRCLGPTPKEVSQQPISSPMESTPLYHPGHRLFIQCYPHVGLLILKERRRHISISLLFHIIEGKSVVPGEDIQEKTDSWTRGYHKQKFKHFTTNPTQFFHPLFTPTTPKWKTLSGLCWRV